MNTSDLTLSNEVLELERKLIDIGVKKSFEGTDDEFWTHQITSTYSINYGKISQRVILSLIGFGAIKTFDKLNIQELESLIDLFLK